jgi:hypothetical protein
LHAVTGAAAEDEKAIDEGAIDVRDGDTAIPYDEEYSSIRSEL